MLKIRLQRVGRKHEPTFRLVLTDSKNSTKSGRYLENLGNYDSRHGETSNFKTDRITHWMSKGAQVSATVHNMLVSKKIIEGKKINVLPLKKPVIKEAKKETPVKTEIPEDIKEEIVEEVPAEELTPTTEKSVEEIAQ
ncbi:MAG: 30S ribosomal protein S16 [Candidatus Zambryskibacteria bacterium]|nr:30S ribosomal protein S16 [Candidatus Zambryskibacteria bacterium]